MYFFLLLELQFYFLNDAIANQDFLVFFKWRTDETALYQLVIRCGYVAEILQNEGTDVVLADDVFKLVSCLTFFCLFPVCLVPLCEMLMLLLVLCSRGTTRM